MKIAVYGGSFNPPHLGHAHALAEAAEYLAPDLLLVLPDNIPPHKDLAENSPSAEARLEMCRLAFSGIPGVTVSDMELKRRGRSYTSDTIQDLRKAYPADSLYLIIGSDMLLSFPSWYRFRYILQEAGLAVLCREREEELSIRKTAEEMKASFGAEVLLIPSVPYPASSTEIREELALGRCPKELASRVYGYIRDHRYYLTQQGE